jgi:hypothetical protein
MEAPMAEGFASEVVKRFTGEIASRLKQASVLASTAETLSTQGLTDHAFETLLDVEPLQSASDESGNAPRSDSKARASLVPAIARGRTWAQEIVSGVRQACSIKVRIA